MALVTITFEDKPEGGVKVEMTPNFETLMKMMVSGHELTSAQAYAIHAANAVRHASKQQGDRLPILVPRIGT